MSSKHRRTIAAVFEDPVRSSILWNDVVSLLLHLGATMRQGSGSRVRVMLRGKRVTLHLPHPQKEVNTYTVRDLREFLHRTGVVR